VLRSFFLNTLLQQGHRGGSSRRYNRSSDADACSDALRRPNCDPSGVRQLRHHWLGRSVAALLWMTIILCAVIATIRRERVFTAGLNHWDEMVATTALYCAVTEINRLSAF
jgi:hypothetical protein